MPEPQALFIALILFFPNGQANRQSKIDRRAVWRNGCSQAKTGRSDPGVLADPGYEEEAQARRGERSGQDEEEKKVKEKKRKGKRKGKGKERGGGGVLKLKIYAKGTLAKLFLFLTTSFS